MFISPSAFICRTSSLAAGLGDEPPRSDGSNLCNQFGRARGPTQRSSSAAFMRSVVKLKFHLGPFSLSPRFFSVMEPDQVPPKPSTFVTSTERRPSLQFNVLSCTASGWFNPATASFALLKRILPFQRPLNGFCHSHRVTASASPVSSHP